MLNLLYSYIVFYVNCIYTLVVMNREALIHEFASRPKVYRLPFAAEQEMDAANMAINYDLIKQFMWLLLAVVLVFAIYRYNTGLTDKDVLSPDDARLLALINSSDDIRKSNGSTLYFRDNEGIIVGSMVKIEADSGKAVAIQNSTDPSRNTERGLLAILSKY